MMMTMMMTVPSDLASETPNKISSGQLYFLLFMPQLSFTNGQIELAIVMLLSDNNRNWLCFLNVNAPTEFAEQSNQLGARTA